MPVVPSHPPGARGVRRRRPPARTTGGEATESRARCVPRYTSIDIYADANAYYYDSLFKRTPKPGYRDE